MRLLRTTARGSTEDLRQAGLDLLQSEVRRSTATESQEIVLKMSWFLSFPLLDHCMNWIDD